NGDDDSGMGGLVVGMGGSVAGVFDVNRNGSIPNLSAGRIAAILAGQHVSAGNLTESNAVKNITGLSASFIGADVDLDRQLDFNEGVTVVAGFQLNDDAADTDDSAIDGVVIV